MTSKEQLTRLQEYADALLGAFLGLRLNYGLLAPLLGGVDLPISTPPRRQLVHGLSALRNTLFFSCALDVVKLSWDRDRRTASVANIVAQLERPEVLQLVKDNPLFSVVIPRKSYDEGDKEGLRAIEEAENHRRRVQIDKQLTRLLALWTDYENHGFKNAFITLRDQHLAHLEVRPQGGGYEPLDINGFKILRSDLATALKLLGPIIVEINRIVRDADFALDQAAKAFDQDGRRFWEPLLQSGSEGGPA
ncbi:hypothetical protein [Longimicrobium sp.]|uniref:AbiU2 domain-containing protein n=1 Tax=Longimicrobium sp. TaxID=2029185 RepID=UPI002F92DFD6